MTRIHDTTYIRAPWNIPVPVRRGRFVGHAAHLAQFNVEVDYTRMRAYGARKAALPPHELLFTDLQTNSDQHVPGRLGAGRAGCFRGRYVKGVGRTPLAANWNNPGDQEVATGHHHTSAAIREYIASCFFRAKRKEHLLNGCEGVLLGPLDPSLADPTAYGHRDESTVAPCNRHLQALTVKGARFARFSNFAWLINHIELHRRSNDSFNYFVYFQRYLDPSRDVAMAEITPDNVARAFDAAIERGLANFREFWRLGVFFGAPYNNFTMDGRYHDLDSPYFAGAPYLGVLPRSPMTELVVPEFNPSRIFGLEVLAYVHYVRIFYRFLLARLGSLPQMECVFPPRHREFLRDTAAALRRTFDRNHVLMSPGRLVDRVVEWIREDCGVEGRDLKQARALVQIACHRRVSMKLSPRKASFPLRSLPVKGARPGTIRVYEPPAAVAFCRVPERAFEEAGFMQALIEDLDETSDRDELLRKLAEAQGRIDRACGAPPASA